MELKSTGNGSLPYTKQMAAGLGEINCSDWVAGASIVAYGVRVGIRTNRPDYLTMLLGLLPRVWKPSAAQLVERLYSLRVAETGARKNRRSVYQLYEDQTPISSSNKLDSVLDSFERELKLYIAEMARRRTFVHAGAVGWQGKAIIVPGSSFSGKTSLVAEMVRAGATYYSDEYAVLDEHGRVHPYPTPLAVRKPGSQLQEKRSAEEYGGDIGVKPLPVGLVIVSRYEPGERWRPRRLSAGRAVLEILANTVSARRKPEAALSALRKIVIDAPVLKGERGEADETASLILGS
jgi:hypothetical protein